MDDTMEEFDLNDMKCVPCRKGAPTVTAAEIAELHPQIPDWQIVEHDGMKRLERVFKLPNFVQALDLANRVGAAAEEEGHHPDIGFGWGYATVSLRTKKIKGLHENDFIMATKLDRIAGGSPAP